MNANLADIYANAAKLGGDPETPATAAFRYVEKFHAFDQTIPWAAWFAEQPEELNRVLGLIQQSVSYHTYSEHFLSGMQHWERGLLLSPEHMTSLVSFGFTVNESVWHALGRRKNGEVLIEMVGAVRAATNLDLATGRGGNVHRAAAVGLYTGHVQRFVDDWRSGNNVRTIGQWCERAGKNPMVQTWELFCEKYPDLGGLLVYCALNHQNTSEGKEFARAWLVNHPGQHEALYAYIYYGPHTWGISHDMTYGTEVAKNAREKGALMTSLFPEVKDVETYLRTYAHLFTMHAPPAVIALPEDMEP